MNYRHAFHAGNHADVFKHIVLTQIIALLCKKEAPFAYIDTHAGIGLYDLNESEATRTGEWEEGIGKLLKCDNPPELLNNYFAVINQLNPKTPFRYYPGSPLLAKHLMRVQDRIILNELHPEDNGLLKCNMQHDPRVSIHQEDGWLLPKALLPVLEKRALILIDPPFEIEGEHDRCATAVIETIKRMRQAVIMAWYPIKDQRDLSIFYRTMKETNAPKILRAEFMIKEVDNTLGLNGSGMMIVNPPWGLEEALKKLLPFLVNVMSDKRGDFRVDWLIEE